MVTGWWDALPTEVHEFAVKFTAGLAVRFFPARSKDAEAEEAFGEAVTEGVKCFLSSFESEADDPAFLKGLLSHPDASAFFYRLIENGRYSESDTDDLEQLYRSLHDTGIDPATSKGFEPQKALDAFMRGFRSKAQFSDKLVPYFAYLRTVKTQELLESQEETAQDVREIRNLLTGKASSLDTLRQEYFTRIIQEYSFVRTKGYTKNDPSRILFEPLPLAEIYTDLLLVPENTDGERNTPEMDSNALARQETALRKMNITDIVNGRYTVIIGAPGAGKSTILKYVALAYAENSQEDRLNSKDALLPIFFPISKYAKYCRNQSSPIPLKEYIPQHYRSMGLTDLGPLFADALERGKAIVLFDGLDEVADESERSSMVDAVRWFITDSNHHPENRYVITCRKQSYTPASRFEPIDGTSFVHLEVQPFDSDRIGKFLLAWYRWYEREVNKCPDNEGAAESARDHMLGTIESNEKIFSLAASPLLLTILVLIEHGGGRLPSSRAELYQDCLEMFAGQWDVIRRGFDPGGTPKWDIGGYEINRSFLVEFLGPLSLEMQREATLQVEEKILRKTFERKFASDPRLQPTLARQYADNLNTVLKERSGLLQKTTTGMFEYIHPTFREYLAACWLADECEAPLEALGANLFESEWREIACLTLATLTTKGRREFVRDVLGNKKVYPRNVLLLGDCFADLGGDLIPNESYKDLMDKLETVALGQYPPREKASSAESLGWLGDKRKLEDKFASIPAGDYLLADLSSQPIAVAAFNLGKYPVTNRWFEEFVAAGGYTDERLRETVWSPEGQLWLAHTKAKGPAFWQDRKWGCPTAPVVGVCWYEADAFCRWLTKTRGKSYRLPTEAEWQAAAAGHDQRKYPWGNEEEVACNTRESKIGKTSSVGIFSAADTPATGISDLVGNVWEWTGTEYHGREELEDFPFDPKLQRLRGERNWDTLLEKLREKDRKLPVLRGGSCYNHRDVARCATRNGNHPGFRGNLIGFRCARTKK